MAAKPLSFGNLSLNDPAYDDDITRGITDSDTRLMEMIAAQAAHSAGGGIDDVEGLANDSKLSDDEKKSMLQKALAMAASNGNVDLVKRLLAGKPKEYVDVNTPDEDGTPALIYASCFVSSTLQALVVV